MHGHETAAASYCSHTYQLTRYLYVAPDKALKHMFERLPYQPILQHVLATSVNNPADVQTPHSILQRCVMYSCAICMRCIRLYFTPASPSHPVSHILINPPPKRPNRCTHKSSPVRCCAYLGLMHCPVPKHCPPPLLPHPCPARPPALHPLACPPPCQHARLLHIHTLPVLCLPPSLPAYQAASHPAPCLSLCRRRAATTYAALHQNTLRPSLPALQTALLLNSCPLPLPGPQAVLLLHPYFPACLHLELMYSQHPCPPP